MSTMTEAIAELDRDGFTTQFRIDPDGAIMAADRAWSVDQVTVERTVRLEGMSNPDDQSMVLALRAGEVKGTLVLPYGPDLAGPQADTVRALAVRR